MPWPADQLGILCANMRPQAIRLFGTHRGPKTSVQPVCLRTQRGPGQGTPRWQPPLALHQQRHSLQAAPQTTQVAGILG